MPAAKQSASVTATTLNVRRAAGTAAEKVGELKRGARVNILARSGSWYEIQADGRGLRGFVHGDYLHLDVTPVASGFLCHDEALCAAPLPLAEEELVSIVKLKGDARRTADAWNRFGGMLKLLCSTVQLPASAAVAVLCVESSGRGFSDGRMIIRFENHVFWDNWGKRNEAEFKKHFGYDAAKRWTNHRFRETAKGKWRDSHTGQAAEWAAFTFARALSAPAVMLSISMGAPQIMGFNHARAGYDSAQQMFDRFTGDERFHVLGLFDFIKGPGATSSMLEALRRERYEQFATGYNGNGQAAAYGARLRSAVNAFQSAVPDV